jgi:hypothetical protein
MAPIDDETLDRLLTSHLSARLDGQLGRAEPAFRRRLAEAADAGVTTAAGSADDVTANDMAANDVAPMRLVPPFAGNDQVDAEDIQPRARTSRPQARRHPTVWRQPGGWLWAAAGAAMAAAVAVVFVLPNAGPQPAGNTGGGNGQLAVTRPADPAVPGRPPGPPTVRYIHNRTWDEGTYAPGGSAAPVRRFRRQQVEHVRFYDADRGAWVELTVPHEDVELFELDTY